jgi:outer membrane protein assembly factor BamB
MAAAALGTAAVVGASGARPGAAAGLDWPQWRGPARDAVSRETGLLPEWTSGGPPLVWKASGLGAGFSSLAVSGARLYTLGDRDGAQQVVAVRLTDGKVVWTARVGAPWDDEYAGPRSTPTVDGDRVYALGTEGDLVCLDAASGRERWRRSLSRDFGGRMMSGWKFSESPLVDGDRVIVTPGAPKAALVALDKRTGREVWRSAVPDLGPKGRDGAGYSSAVASNGAGVRQYVQLMGRGLVGVRAADGAFLWGYNPVANDVANVSTPVVSGDHVFASTGYQTGAALVRLVPAAGGGVAAREVYFLDSKTFQSHHGGFVLVDGYLYAGHGHRMGLPICIELASGRVMWGGQARNAGRGSAAAIFADGNLYFRYESGLMMLIEASPRGYRERGSFEIPGVRAPSWSHPAIAGGRLYLREQDRLYCYDLRRG